MEYTSGNFKDPHEETTLTGVAHAFVWIAMGGWLAVAGFGCFCAYRYQDKLGRTVTPERPVSTLVIIPIRGVPEHLRELWQGLCAQIYRPFRVIFVVESDTDPAYDALSALALCAPPSSASGAPPLERVVAGCARDTGQKVHNLLAALGRLTREDRIIVFADADIVPPPDWLTRIVVGLENPQVAAVSGYRWLMPERDNLATLIVCAANASIATLPRPRYLNHAWGGTMALRRETLDGIDIERVWRGSLLDDLPLSTALRMRGGAILGPRELLLPTPVAFSWRSAFGFARRQYLFVRIYTPKLWVFAAGGVTLGVLGWAVTVPLALAGDWFAIATFLVANALDQARALLRRRVVRSLWGKEGLGRLRRVLWLDRWGTPLWLTFHAIVIWSTLFGRTMTWADRVYFIEAPRRLRLLRGPGGGLNP